ncbi:MAG: hypothetical protein Q8P19_01870 [bacterium]|nr:hypothetical protein [bacterium]
MVGLTTLLWVLSALFVVFLAARTLGLKVCAACAAVSTTWLGLLALLFLGKDVDPLMIGILMGGSVVGVMYLLREKLPEEYQLFTFPFMATLFALVYILLDDARAERGAYLLLIAVWTVFIALFSQRGNERMNGMVQKIIQCCKNW